MRKGRGAPGPYIRQAGRRTSELQPQFPYCGPPWLGRVQPLTGHNGGRRICLCPPSDDRQTTIAPHSHIRSHSRNGAACPRMYAPHCLPADGLWSWQHKAVRDAVVPVRPYRTHLGCAGEILLLPALPERFPRTHSSKAASQGSPKQSSTIKSSKAAHTRPPCRGRLRKNV